MKKISVIIFLLFITSVCYSQVADDFGDGDFTSSPAWSGSITEFTVNSSKQLQLNNTVAATSYLSTPFSTTSLDNYEWQGYVKQSFLSSGNNNGRIYLVSDQADLTQPLNGYYLQFGEALSNDAVELFKQTGTTVTSVCRGTDATIASSFALRFKVTRDGNGLWSLYIFYITPNPSTDFVLEATGTDATITSSSYFGVLCVYTVSNATKFFYDDFSVGSSIQPDITPPTVTSVNVTSSNTLSVLFSETVDPVSSQNVLSYSANNNLGNPSSAILQADQSTVLLTFTNNFQNGIQNQLSVSNVQDLAANIMTTASFPFLFFQPQPVNFKDIILTEIFADPAPQVGLPNSEYVEILNRSTNPIDVSSLVFSDGTSKATFVSQIIFPNQYWVVTSSSNANLFSGNVIGVSNFPTLNTSGDNLTLKYNGQTIDSFAYTLDWYHDTDKQEGGWSLEIIDPNNTCGEIENWTSSEDASGGTPGKQNSVFANKPDLKGPKFESVVAASDFVLILNFDEKLEKDISTASFVIDPAISVLAKTFADNSLKQIKVDLQQKLQPRTLYQISISDLADCAGNLIQNDFSKLSFALPESSDSLDLVVNEALFNPRTGGVDFVEVYNNSPKFINLNNWKLSNFENGSASNSKTITQTDFVISPMSYVAFTTDPSILTSQYPNTVQKNLFTTALPSLPDDAGSIAIVSDNGKVIDAFSYSDKMHSAFVKDSEGVSLERISFSAPTNESANWKSANASSGFATPGYLNSNARPESTVNPNVVSVEPEIFSPTTPGTDFTKINFRFDQSGMVANIKVLDAQGRLIKTVANNETLASIGSYRWDGDRDDGSHARFGYYIVWFEVFDNSGSTQVFRKRAVITK